MYADGCRLLQPLTTYPFIHFKKETTYFSRTLKLSNQLFMYVHMPYLSLGTFLQTHPVLDQTQVTEMTGPHSITPMSRSFSVKKHIERAFTKGELTYISSPGFSLVFLATDSVL